MWGNLNHMGPCRSISKIEDYWPKANSAKALAAAFGFMWGTLKTTVQPLLGHRAGIVLLRKPFGNGSCCSAILWQRQKLGVVHLLPSVHYLSKDICVPWCFQEGLAVIDVAGKIAFGLPATHTTAEFNDPNTLKSIAKSKMSWPVKIRLPKGRPERESSSSIIKRSENQRRRVA